jgi:outer membrane receptor for ferrienterochelin and colicin
LFGNINVKENNTNAEARVALTSELTNFLILKYGGNCILHYYGVTLNDYSKDTAFKTGFEDYLSSVYIESEIQLIRKFAIRLGERAEYSSLLEKGNIAPRSSLAYKLNQNSQFSVAFGNFYQTPQNDQLRFKHQLNFEKALHYIVNYQWSVNDDYIFRIEAYYKQYTSLVKDSATNNYFLYSLNNKGNGYSKGLDIFWRDKKTFKNADYWISYSYVDTKRNYKEYPVSATPSFVAKHNLSLVGKWYLPVLKTQIGFTWSYASGRPYYNPNNPVFMSNKTKDYRDLSLNASYLTSIFKKFTVIHFAVSNVLGRNNIFGYHYYSYPDKDGVYQAIPTGSNAKRFILAGIFISVF